MKNNYSLFTALLLGFFSVSAQTKLEKADLKLSMGNKWYMTVYNNTTVQLPATNTGITYDFSALAAPNSRDTLTVGSSASAEFSVLSETLPPLHYNSNDSAIYLKATELFGFSASSTNANGLYDGLPRWTGKPTINDQSNSNLNMTIILTTELLGTGTVTTSYGTFNVWMIKQVIEVPNFNSYTYLFFETKEFGRIAIVSNYNGTSGTFYLMEDNNFNPVGGIGTEDVNVNSTTIFPNPATSEVAIQSSAPMESVQFYDALGNLVAQEAVSGNNLSFDVSGFSSGIYLAVITSNGMTTSKKFVVK